MMKVEKLLPSHHSITKTLSLFEVLFSFIPFKLDLPSVTSICGLGNFCHFGRLIIDSKSFIYRLLLLQFELSFIFQIFQIHWEMELLFNRKLANLYHSNLSTASNVFLWPIILSSSSSFTSSKLHKNGMSKRKDRIIRSNNSVNYIC